MIDERDTTASLREEENGESDLGQASLRGEENGEADMGQLVTASTSRDDADVVTTKMPVSDQVQEEAEEATGEPEDSDGFKTPIPTPSTLRAESLKSKLGSPHASTLEDDESQRVSVIA